MLRLRSAWETIASTLSSLLEWVRRKEQLPHSRRRQVGEAEVGSRSIRKFAMDPTIKIPLGLLCSVFLFWDVLNALGRPAFPRQLWRLWAKPLSGFWKVR